MLPTIPPQNCRASIPITAPTMGMYGRNRNRGLPGQMLSVHFAVPIATPATKIITSRSRVEKRNHRLFFFFSQHADILTYNLVQTHRRQKSLDGGFGKWPYDRYDASRRTQDTLAGQPARN